MRVRIYQPTKNTMQSGRAKTQDWLVEPELVTAREPDSLMGWSSAGDTLGTLLNKLRFATADEAIAYAHRQGFEYYVDAPSERRVQPRSYLDNFRTTRPQDEERAAKTKA